ncbi:MAG TPA: hypothetical protein VG742_18895 [Dongiaceae bacterium]|nr:hypothetical protein [Dongiaceae bacterium]
MPESIARIVRGFSMLRLLSIATLLLVIACLIVSASIALADDAPASDQPDVSVDDASTTDTYAFDFEIENLPDAEFAEFIKH